MDEKCEECLWCDDITGACTSEEECIEGNAFVKELGPEEMFKALYMLLYTCGGEMSVPCKAFEQVDDTMKILPSYDVKNKSYVLETSHKPPPPKLIKVPNKILRRNRKLIVPGGN